MKRRKADRDGTGQGVAEHREDHFPDRSTGSCMVCFGAGCCGVNNWSGCAHGCETMQFAGYRRGIDLFVPCKMTMDES